MYDFHYRYAMSTFDRGLKLEYMDTDSFIYEIMEHDVYQQIKQDIHRFDTSNFPTDNNYGIPLANKRVVGLLKDENGGSLMTEYVGLRAKLYTFALEGDDGANISKRRRVLTIS